MDKACAPTGNRSSEHKDSQSSFAGPTRHIQLTVTPERKRIMTEGLDNYRCHNRSFDSVMSEPRGKVSTGPRQYIGRHHINIIENEQGVNQKEIKKTASIDSAHSGVSAPRAVMDRLESSHNTPGRSIPNSGDIKLVSPPKLEGRSRGNVNFFDGWTSAPSAILDSPYPYGDTGHSYHHPNHSPHPTGGTCYQYPPSSPVRRGPEVDHFQDPNLNTRFVQKPSYPPSYHVSHGAPLSPHQRYGDYSQSPYQKVNDYHRRYHKRIDSSGSGPDLIKTETTEMIPYRYSGGGVINQSTSFTGYYSAPPSISESFDSDFHHREGSQNFSEAQTGLQKSTGQDQSEALRSHRYEYMPRPSVPSYSYRGPPPPPPGAPLSQSLSHGDGGSYRVNGRSSASGYTPYREGDYYQASTSSFPSIDRPPFTHEYDTGTNHTAYRSQREFEDDNKVSPNPNASSYRTPDRSRRSSEMDSLTPSSSSPRAKTLSSRTKPSKAAHAAIAAGLTEPSCAREVPFDVRDPPLKPIVPPSVEPVCSVLCDMNPNDVLLGRGGGTNTQVGNRRFRNLVQDFQPTYLLCRRKEKPLIARTIVLIIRKRGGRFLRKDETTAMLFEVGDEKAEAKTSQALREGLDVRASRSTTLMVRKNSKKVSPKSVTTEGNSEKVDEYSSPQRAGEINAPVLDHSPVWRDRQPVYDDYCHQGGYYDIYDEFPYRRSRKRPLSLPSNSGHYYPPPPPHHPYNIYPNQAHDYYSSYSGPLSQIPPTRMPAQSSSSEEETPFVAKEFRPPRPLPKKVANTEIHSKFR